eukprot:TRINITY_DN6320_c0_g1_i1.p2 TRINITY_DN6320_c0_g1~~TRINITY_DN6320_c0_g1_i1.p2  ORF type:complete len:130 (+),score=27.48 TRINITY_DN6320_c0_g1_i1:385-774(+)
MLDEAVDHLSAAAYPSELLVVDDGSTDGTSRVVTAYAARRATPHVAVRLLRQVPNGARAPPSARAPPPPRGRGCSWPTPTARRALPTSTPSLPPLPRRAPTRRSAAARTCVPAGPSPLPTGGCARATRD